MHCLTPIFMEEQVQYTLLEDATAQKGKGKRKLLPRPCFVCAWNSAEKMDVTESWDWKNSFLWVVILRFPNFALQKDGNFGWHSSQGWDRCKSISDMWGSHCNHHQSLSNELHRFPPLLSSRLPPLPSQFLDEVDNYSNRRSSGGEV